MSWEDQTLSHITNNALLKFAASVELPPLHRESDVDEGHYIILTLQDLEVLPRAFLE
jgi:hypothetical protein